MNILYPVVKEFSDHLICCMLYDIWCSVYQVKKKGKRKVIGVLDIYGFEIFKVKTVVVSKYMNMNAVHCTQLASTP